MKTAIATFFAAASLLCAGELPLVAPGGAVRYHLAAAVTRQSVVSAFTLQTEGKWFSLSAVKRDGAVFRIWLLNPDAPERYILQEGTAAPREYRDAETGGAVLPAAVSLGKLLPQTIPGSTDADYLGHRYIREEAIRAGWTAPTGVKTLALHPDRMAGPASNARMKDDTRRWDGSDYAMVRFTESDYRELAAAGVTCVKADDEQAAWADSLNLYYWGAGAKLPYPEMLYRSQYLGPVLFLDEPAVGTRDHVLRPRLANDAAFRKSIRPADAFTAFRAYYDDALSNGAPAALGSMLKARSDVDTGSLSLGQEDLFSWETMVDTAAWELSRRPSVPAAFVFEPPGRIGAARTLPELDMTAGTQYGAADAKALADLIFSFLRGAARLTGKDWGISIYGAVDRADAFTLLTRAWDMGATRFYFWDNAQLAAVPFSEYLALARHLRNHAANHPARDTVRLKQAAEVAIALPPGYDLGHTQMGLGNLWGVGELNLERRNDQGIPYREVMSNFHLEAERCESQGIPYDAFWDLPGLSPRGYREIVHIREDGQVLVESGGSRQLLASARRIAPKPGEPPQLSIEVTGGAGALVTATARVRETSAPVYYTHGTDDEGIYRNAMVLWELYGPDEEDYRAIAPGGMKPVVRRNGPEALIEASFRLDRPGHYRLRAATVDAVGRRQVVWREMELSPDRVFRLIR